MKIVLRRCTSFGAYQQQCPTRVICQHHRTLRVLATECNDGGETCNSYVVGHASHAADVGMLEEAYRQAAVPSPGPTHAARSAHIRRRRYPQQQLLQHSLSSAAAQGQRQPQRQFQHTARALYFSPLLPVLRALRSTERRLEAKVPAIGNSIVLMTAVIAYDFGVNNVLDRLLGESPLGSLSCILVGLGMVVGVRLAGFKVLNFWEV